MITTMMILDLLKDKLGSDYKTAKEFNVSCQRISYIRTKGGILTDEQGLKAAELLDFPKEFIILSLAAERSLNGPAHDALAEISNKYDPRKSAAVAAFIVVASGLLIEGLPGQLAALAI